jgi:hypothetical protein
MDPERELPHALSALAGFFDAGGEACDFAALAASRERGHLAVCLQALADFDPARLRIAAQTAFWVNLYNAAALRDTPELLVSLEAGGRELAAYCARPRLRLGGLEYSLDDLYHGVLRGNAPVPGHFRAPMRRDDPRLAHVPIALDDRLHFVLWRGARSSPAFRVCEAGRLDEALEDAAARYLRRTVRVDARARTLEAPALLRWFAADFGGAAGVLEFVLARLDEEAIAPLGEDPGRMKLRYAAFDWRPARRAA